MASSLLHPWMRSAAGFQDVAFPSRLTVMIPIGDDWITASSISCVRRKSSIAFVCSVMSVWGRHITSPESVGPIANSDKVQLHLLSAELTRYDRGILRNCPPYKLHGRGIGATFCVDKHPKSQ